jgi:hypothetical protein
VADKPEKLNASAPGSAVAVAQAGAAPATAQNKTEIAYLLKYRTSEKFKAMHLDATKWAFKNLLPYKCKNINALEGARSAINIIQAFIFNKETGEPEFGHWRETTKFTACGRRHLQHIEFIARGAGDLRAVVMAPGDSIADHALQADVVVTMKAMLADKYKRTKSAKDVDDSVSCDSTHLIDTELLSKNLPDPPSNWRESWYFDQCGSVTATNIGFETTPMGIMFKADISAR